MRYFGIIMIIMCASVVIGQQDPFFTDYKLNQFLVNPSRVGVEEGNNQFTFINRSQWVGIADAPETQMLSGSMYVPKSRIGMGINLYRDSAKPYKSFSISTDFAYSIKLKYLTISAGLRANFSSIRVPLSTLAVDDLDDFVFSGEDIQRSLLNFGAGITIFSKYFYLAMAQPKLVRSTLLGNDEIMNDQAGYEQSLILGGGVVINVDEDLTFRPGIYYRRIENVPNASDIYISAIYKNKYEITPFFKLDQSRGILVSVIQGSFRIGYSYEGYTTNIKRFSSGTHEVSLTYFFKELFPTDSQYMGF